MRDSGYQSAALADIEAARAWYEEQHAGLGEESVAAVEAAVSEIVRFPRPGRWSIETLGATWWSASRTASTTA